MIQTKYWFVLSIGLFAFHIPRGLQAQCGEVLGSTIDPPQCFTTCDLCAGDQVTITTFGQGLPDGGTIDFYFDTNPDFDAYNGDGTLMGSADISTPMPDPCTACPYPTAIMIDACIVPEAAGEFVMMGSGLGFDVDDLEIDFAPENNFGGAANDDINLGGACSWQAGNPGFVSGCNNVIPVGPGQSVPAGVTVIILTSANAAGAFDFSATCPNDEPIYVIQNTCTRIFGAFSNGASTGLRTTTFSLNGCGCSLDFTYDTDDPAIDPPMNGDYLSGVNGFGNSCSVAPAEPTSPIPPFPSTIDPFNFTFGNSFCGSGPYYIRGIINPAPSDPACQDTTELFTININCPTANSTGTTECDDGSGSATFDLTTIENTVNGGTGDPVLWYTDATGNNLISNPTMYTSSGGFVYAQVIAGSCFSNIVPVSLTVLPSPTANPAAASACDNGSGQALFNLTQLNGTVNGGTGNIVSWYEDFGLSIPISNPGAFLSGGGSVYATVFDGQCTSPPAVVSLTLLPIPSGISTSTSLCDQGGNQASFNLTLLDPTVNGGSGNPVSWFQDAGANNPVPNPFNFQTGSTTVYAQIMDASNMCLSIPVPVTLTVLPLPVATPTADAVCADATNQGTFDLVQLESVINNGLGYSVSWFQDIGLSNPIGNPMSFTIPFPGQTIYATINDGQCNSEPVAITLDVLMLPVTQPTTLNACGDANGFGTFDLTQSEPIVTNFLGYDVTWYQDMNATMPIGTPTLYSSPGGTVYAVVFDGNCSSQPQAVELVVTLSPIASPTAASACADPNGIATFNLFDLEFAVQGGSGLPVSWFEEPSGLNLIANPANYTTTAPGGSVYASVNDGLCASPIVEVVLIVQSQPPAFEATDFGCANASGTVTFDLSTLQQTITGGLSNSVSFLTDTTNMTSVADPNNFTSDGDTLFAVVDNGSCSSGPVPVVLEVAVIPSPINYDTTFCGNATFNLFDFSDSLGISAADTILWYADPGETTPITHPDSVFFAAEDTLYFVLTNGLCPSDTAQMVFHSENLLSGIPLDTTLCDDGFGSAMVDLTAFETSLSSLSPDTTLWYTDANATNTIADPSNFFTGPNTVYAVLESDNCLSEPIPVQINLDPTPEAVPTQTSLCDSGNGLATFDLIILESTINLNTNLTVEWFTDADGNLPILNPGAFASNGQVVFAQVTNGTCASFIVGVNLQVDPLPTAFTTSDTVCDDGSGSAAFDLTSLTNTVNGGSGETIFFFEDLALTIPISSPYTSGGGMVYAVVESNDGCQSLPVEISLILEETPIAVAAEATLCETSNGNASFDLTLLENTINDGTGNAVLFYEDVALTLPVNSPYISTSTTIYAVTQNGNCTSTPVEVELTVNDLPQAFDASAESCDDGSGTAAFNLDALVADINGGSTATVLFFEDNQLTTAISSPYTSGNATVFAIVEDANGCRSEIAEVTLTLGGLPQAFEAQAQACDEGGNQATFDLTTLENTINGNSANTVFFFADAALSMPVNSPFNSGSTTLFAVVGNGNCQSAAVEVELTVNDLPQAFDASAESCDDGSGTAAFNLDALVADINGGSTATVLFFEDNQLTTAISSPYTSGNATVFAIVEDANGCQSEIAEVTLSLGGLPQAFEAQAQACDEGGNQATFDLTALEGIINGNSANTVFFFADAALSMPVNSPFNSGSTTLFAVVGNGNCQSAAVEVELTVNDLPQAFDASAESCDDGSGTAAFNLDALTSDINGGSTATVLFFEDDQLTTAISSPYTSGNATVFAIVEDANGCQSEIAEVTLSLGGLPQAFEAQAQACDEGGNQATFDLTALEGIINGNSANTVFFFADAALSMPVNSPFNSGSTTLFAVVGNGNCQSAAVEVELTVNDLPQAFDASAESCDDGSGTAAFNLDALVADINGGSTATVLFFEDDQFTTPIPSPYTSGNATVFAIVEDANGCQSEIAEVTLSLGGLPQAFEAQAQACDEGGNQATFDLTALEGIINGNSANTVFFFADAALSMPVNSPFNSGSTTLFAVVGNGNCQSAAVEVELTVNDLPQAFDASAESCDDGSGTAAFNLDALVADINGGSTATVLFFEDDQLTTPIPSPYTSGNAIVFAIVEDANGCQSEIAEVTLSLGGLPQAFEAQAQACDEGGNQATFDLTALEGIINGNSANTVFFFADAALSMPVNSPFNSGSTTLFAVVGNGNCQSAAVEVELTVNDLPQAFDASAESCDDGSGTAAFNLDALVADINGGSTATVLFFEDDQLTTPIPSPYTSGNATVFAIVENAIGCQSEIAEVTLSLGGLPQAFEAQAQACDEGGNQATFDLTALEGIINGNSANTVFFFADAALSMPVNSPFNSGSTTLFAVVGNGNCQSAAVEVELTVNDVPQAFDASAESCDDGSGTAAFNLDALVADINGGSTATVLFFEDDQLTTPIPSPYTSGNAIVFAIVENANGCRSEIAEVTLSLGGLPQAFEAQAQACDEGGNQATFDLTTLENTINGNSANTVFFFADAALSMPVNSPFNSGSTTLFAVVGNGNCQSAAVEVELTVNDLPQAFDASAESCDDGSGTAAFNLDALTSDINGGSTETVLFFEDDQLTTPIPSPYTSGNDTVFAIVENANGCRSEVAEVTLSLGGLPQAFEAQAQACDEGGNQATFDLTALEGIINGNSANTVFFFADAALSMPVNSPFNSGSTTLFAVVGNGNCQSAAVEVELTVNDVPQAFDASAESCDDGSGTAAFNLDALVADINGGSTATVLFFEDDQLTTPIPSPYTSGNAIVFAIVENANGCRSEIAEVTLSLGGLPQAFEAQAQACDEGGNQATFDLTTLENTINGNSANTVFFFADAALSMPVNSPFNSGSTTLFAVVGNGNCQSAAVEVELTVNDLPQAFDASAESCDDGSGTAAFNLDALVADINGGSTATVLFFEDDQLTTPIPSPYTSGNAIVFAIVENANGCRSEIAEVTLSLGGLPQAFEAQAQACDEGGNQATFDLTTLENTINGNSANTVFFFADDALSMPVNSPFNSGSTTLFAVVGNGNCQSAAVEVELTVNDLPQAFDASAESCDDGSGTAAFNLDALVADINGGSTATVLFFEDDQLTTPIPSPYTSGNAIVFAIVENANGCRSEIAEVTLSLGGLPQAFEAQAQACDEGGNQATFDLTTLENTINGNSANTVFFFADAALSMPVNSPFNSGSTTLFAVVGNGNCQSAAVEVELTVNDLPQAFDASAESCDDGNGTATFDLTILDNMVNGGTGLMVSYFEDQAGTIPVSGNYLSGSTTLFAVVSNGICPSEVVEVDLTVGGNPTASPAQLVVCEDANGMGIFDLSSLEDVINGGTGLPVQFFEDMALNLPISAPYSGQTGVVFAVVGESDCLSEPVEISLTVKPTPQLTAVDGESCDEGGSAATFDLDQLVNLAGNGDIVFSSTSDMNNVIPSVYSSGNTQIFAQAENDGCFSEVIAIELSVILNPLAAPTSLEACLDENGSALFNLDEAIPTVLNGSTGMVEFSTDPNFDTTISGPFLNPPTTIFARIQDGDCFSEAVQVELIGLSPGISLIETTLCEGESLIINGNIYDVDNPFGEEVLAGQATNGCDSLLFIDLDFAEPFSGSIIGETTICQGSATTLTFALGIPDTFSLTINGVTLPQVYENFEYLVQPNITTVYQVTDISLPNGSTCFTLPGAATIIVEEVVIDIEILSLRGAYSSSCDGVEDGAMAVEILSGTEPFAFEWSNGSTASMIEDLADGTYSVTLTDGNGCTTEASGIIASPPPLAVTYLVRDIPCQGDGGLEWLTLDGGTAPYRFSLDGINFSPVDPLALPFIPLSAGDYKLEVRDANDCSQTFDFSLAEGRIPIVDLGRDTVIQLGDSISLEAEANFPFDEVIWTDTSGLSCADCTIPFARPTQTTTYEVTVRDSSGCQASDAVTIFVEKSNVIFVPTAFSPDDDGFNDRFTFFVGPDIEAVESFRVFNRWGAVLYERTDFLPDSSSGWDGSFKGERLNNGVFLYLIQYRKIDGTTGVLSGDITLLR